AVIPELKVLPSRVLRVNVSGLRPYPPPNKCAPYTGDPCAQYPDPWTFCEGAEAEENEIKSLARSLTRFSWEAYKTIAQSNSESNVIISPLSMAAALTHLMLGARNTTKHDLEEALFYTEGNACIHQAFKQLLKRTQSLESASQLFYQEGMCLQGPFLKRSQRFYGNVPAPLGSDSVENLRMINSWVDEKTHGKIPEMLDSLPENPTLMLLNAVYFNGTWKSKFSKEDTVDDTFWLSSGETLQVPTLVDGAHPLASFQYSALNVKVGKLQMFGKNSLIVIVPENWGDLAETERALNINHLQSIIAQLKVTDYRDTTVCFPKLDMKFDLDFLSIFSDLGLLDVALEPNLCGMISHQQVAISQATHKATLTLNEEGVEASAVTSIGVGRTALVFQVQSPFILLLWNDELDFPLFMGRVMDPTK
ncbi:plasma protease C1 inhibitor, partial [Mustelus asterias]